MFQSRPFGTSTFGAPATPAFGAPAFGATTPAFGAAATPAPAFGAATPAFGASTPAFGASATPAFGATPTPTFGAATPAFGATTPAFGAPSTTPAFGAATTAFGAPSTTPAFGATTPAFGATTTPSTFGGFGATTPAFGATTQPSAFGAPSTPAFGATQPATTAFGAAAPTTAFGAATTPSFSFAGAGSTFGAPATPAPAASPFGAPSTPSTFASPFGGTTATTPFGGATSTAFGGFGQTQTQTQAQTPTTGTGNPKFQTTTENDPNGSFTHQSITAMAAYNKKSFEELRWEDYQAGKKNASVAAPILASQPASSPFGATTTTAPTAFGATTTAPTAFGAATTPSPSPFSFNPTPTPSPFGAPATTAPATTPAFGGFGATPSTTTPFGTTTTTTTPAFPSFTPSFGATTPAAPATTTPSFSFTNPATTTTTSSPFGAPAATTPFGATTTATTPAFGAFGSTAQAPTTSTFGTTTTNPFGTTAPAATQSSLFSTAAPAATNTFSATSFSLPAPTVNPFASTTPATIGGTSLFNPAGSTATPPLFSNTFAAPSTPFAAFPSVAQPTVAPVVTTISAPPIATPLPSFPIPNSSPSPSPAATPTPAIPPLTFTPRTPTPQKNSYVSSYPRSLPSRSGSLRIKDSPSYGGSRLFAEDKGLSPSGIHITPESFTLRTSTPSRPRGVDIKKLNLPPFEAEKKHIQIKPPQIEYVTETPLQVTVAPVASDAPIIRNPNYFTKPSLDILKEMSSEELSRVEDFTVGCEEFGYVRWHGKTDVRRLNLNDIVIFEWKAVTVYPEKGLCPKPPLGEGLNRPATVTLYRVFPKKADAAERYAQVIANTTKKFDGKLLNYDPVNGIWEFEVLHFSKYGIDEDGDEEPEVPSKAALATNTFAAPYGYPQGAAKVQVVPSHLPQDSSFSASQPPTPSATAFSPAATPFSTTAPSATATPYSTAQTPFSAAQTPFSAAQTPYSTAQTPFSATQTPFSAAQTPFSASQTPFSAAGTPFSTASTQAPSFSTSRNARSSASVRGTERVLFGELPTSPAQQTSRKEVALTSTSTQKRRGDVPFSAEFIEKEAERMAPTTSGSHRTVPAVRGPGPVFTVPVEKETAIIVHAPQMRLKMLSLEQSISARAPEHTDMGKVMGRSFRVGWGPDGKLLRTGGSIGKLVIDSVPISAPQVNTKRSPQGESSSVIPNRYILELLQTHLGYSQQQHGSFSLTQLDANIQNNIKISEAAISTQQDKHLHLIWTLVYALWGKIHETTLPMESEKDRPMSSQMIRKLLLSKWLSQALLDPVEDSVKAAKSSNKNVLAILHYLTGRQISPAVALAQHSRDFRLAVLLSQTWTVPLQLIATQIEKWEVTGAVKHIDPQLLAVYKLLAGDVEYIGESIADIKKDWLRCFAIHFWYKHIPSTPIPAVIATYETAISQLCAAAPVPPYQSSDEKSAHSDTLYRLLHLYSITSAHQQENADDSEISEQIPSTSSLPKSLLLKVINPANLTDNPMDFSLSWHLYTLLRGIPALSSVVDLPVPQRLHTAYAAQLEMSGMWQWAIYVLLHIEFTYTTVNGQFSFASLKQEVVSSILSRHAANITDKDYHFLTSQLQVPASWVDAAVGRYLIYERQYERGIVRLLRAEEWNEAHRAILVHLIPNALSSTHDTSKTLGVIGHLNTLQSQSAHLSEPSWALGGQIYLAYFKLRQTLGDFSYSDNISDAKKQRLSDELYNIYVLSELVAKWGQLFMDVNSNSNSNPSTTLSTQIGIATIATFVGYLLLALSQFHRDPLIPTHLQSLPIPPDVRSFFCDHIMDFYNTML